MRHVCNSRLSATALPGRSSHLLPPQVLHSARLEISGNASFILDFAILGSLCISVRSRTYAVILKTVSDTDGMKVWLLALLLFVSSANGIGLPVLDDIVDAADDLADDAIDVVEKATPQQLDDAVDAVQASRAHTHCSQEAEASRAYG